MMTAAEFSTIIQEPQNITPEQTLELKSVLDQFPYLQSARASYLKGLKNKGSVKYNNELKRTAAYTTDRSILFDFITSEAFMQNEISKHIKQHLDHIKAIDVDSEDLSSDKKTQIDDVLKKQISDTEGTLDPELFQPKHQKTPIAHFQSEENKASENETLNTDLNKSISNTSTIHEVNPEHNVKADKEEASPNQVLKLGSPLQFDKQEKHSFNEWLMLTRFEPIKRDEPENKPEPTQETSAPLKEKSDKNRTKKFDLIDQFITKNPKLKPSKTSGKSANIADAQMIQPEALMTETLARIYVEQKNYKKAIQSYNILSLKYPEKSGFFADQIKAVKQLQEQNND